jgi:hypothetical protein
MMVALLGLAGCGSEKAEQSTPEKTPTAAPSASSGKPIATPQAADKIQTIDIAFKGGKVTPNNKQVRVKAGAPLRLHITADSPGEIHVHSTPEQEIEYDAGVSDKTVKNLDQPGVVDMESHTLETLILQLEVR